MAILFLLFLSCCVLKESFGYSQKNIDFFKKKRGMSVIGSSYNSYPANSNIICTIICEADPQCQAFQMINGKCELFVVSSTTFSYNPSLSSLGVPFFDRIALWSPRNGPAPNFFGFWGVWTGWAGQCNQFSGVNEINVWVDPYNGYGMTIDDVGISEIETVCSDENGKITDKNKLGTYWSSSVLRTYKCPSNSFIKAIQFETQYTTLGLEDDVGMIGLNVKCNDPASTAVTVVADGLGFAGSVFWSNWMECEPGFVLCDFSVRIEPDNSDNTIINAMQIRCCFLCCY